jgi:transglutaminase superfamily protein
MLRRLDADKLRAAWWAWHSVRGLRRALPTAGLGARVPAPPDVPPGTESAVGRTLHVRRATCLERSLVLQAWLSAHGRPHEVLIGVPGVGRDGFEAHAWLAGYDPDSEGDGLEVLDRIAPP